MKKTCKYCDKEKDISCFKSTKSWYCQDCIKITIENAKVKKNERTKASHKKPENQEKLRNYMKEYRKRDYVKQKTKEYRNRPDVKKRNRINNSANYEKNGGYFPKVAYLILKNNKPIGFLYIEKNAKELCEKNSYEYVKINHIIYTGKNHSTKP